MGALSSAEIATMVYPTEVEERVKLILLSLTSGSEAEIKERKFTSHYGYSFRELVLKLDGRSAESLLRSLVCSLSDFDFLSLLGKNLESHIDGKNLYIRLDKQELALGRYSLFSGGPGGYVRIVLTFRGDMRELRSFLSDLREKNCPT